MEKCAFDPASTSLVAVARKYREQLPCRFKDAAALGLLFDGAPE
jgi:hypothetical protein